MTTKLLYCLLIGLADDSGYCYPSNEYVAQRLSVDKTHISRYLKQLTNKNYIKTSYDKNNKRIVQVNNFQQNYNSYIKVYHKTMLIEIGIVSKVLYSLIKSFKNDCVATNDYLSSAIGCNERSIVRALSQLKEEELIKIHYDLDKKSKRVNIRTIKIQPKT
ncbi:MAG: winged helix DNA-binding protein [Mycoplasma sp.]|nr:winged helix DNA-binding protein [Mycoplasma sp.]